MYKTVKVELSYGCNLRCEFCGIQSEEKRAPLFMDERTINTAIEHVAEDPRNLTVSFSLRGEPTLNPLYLKAVRLAASCAHRVVMVTNGTTLTTEALDALFLAGLDALHVDVYTPQVRRFIDGLKTNPLYDVADYGQENKIWTGASGAVIVCDERESRQNNTRALHNWAGANMRFCAPEELPREAPCAEPLKMITIRYDGSYALCCHSWQDKITFGTVREYGLLAHYNNEKYLSIAKAVMRKGGRSGVLSCRLCNVKSPFAHMFKRAVNL